MSDLVVIFVLLVIVGAFVLGYLFGMRKLHKCSDDLDNIRDILFEENSNHDT